MEAIIAVYFSVGLFAAGFFGSDDGLFWTENMRARDILMFLFAMIAWPPFLCLYLAKPRDFRKYVPNTKVPPEIISVLWMPPLWTGPGEDIWWLLEEEDDDEEDRDHGWFTLFVDGDFFNFGYKGRTFAKCLGDMDCECEARYGGECQHYHIGVPI